jgi:drug/metabolite transporter (DMT)-like permease
MKPETLKIFGWLAILVFVEFWALFFVQKSQKIKDKKYLIFTMILYGTCISLLLYKLLEYKNIAIVNFLWNIFSTLSGFFIALVIYKEEINNLEWAGAALGILSLGLIIYGGSQKGKGKSK